MSETGDTSANLRRLEAALERIAQAARRRPPAPQPAAEPESRPAPRDSADKTQPWAPASNHDEAVLKIDEIIGGLRNALGIERNG
ncbi:MULTISPECIES: hypothetical protein [unclassified Acidisoma]|jgi:hypothetical protein|uniref:hypothetical protein n=1 Tax=unclassified Acidisoma TaxID=2634065 RepID=UPI00131E3A2D|nr:MULTISPECIES: hypothetical protein [unclassified Acidisoma]